MTENQSQLLTKKRMFFSFLLQFFGLGLVYGGSKHWSKWLYSFISISIVVLIFTLSTRFNEVYISNTTLLNVSFNCLIMLIYPMTLFDSTFSSTLPIIAHFIGITYWLVGFTDLIFMFFKIDLKQIRTIYLSILVLVSVLWFLKISSYDNEIGSYREGLTNVSQKGKHGFINRIGKEVIPLQYDDAYTFYEGLAHISKNNKHGFIDKTGKEVIAPKYDDAHDFSEGLAAVNKGNLWGFIDKTGKEVITIQYSYNEYVNYHFDFSQGLAHVIKNGKDFYINKQGECVKDCPK